MSVFHSNRYPEFVSKYSLGKRQAIAYTLTESPHDSGNGARFEHPAVFIIES